MIPVPYIDIHTHLKRSETGTIIVRNIFPGDNFDAFSGHNFYSVGLHPWYLKTTPENNRLIDMIEAALEFDQVCFIGECGLDKKINIDFDEQIRVFREQAFLAETFKRPLIIHCVKAYNEIFEIHEKLHPEMPWIMHGFRGNLQITKQLEKKGFSVFVW